MHPTPDHYSAAAFRADMLGARYFRLKSTKETRAQFIERLARGLAEREVEREAEKMRFAAAQEAERAMLAAMSPVERAERDLALAEMNDTDHSALIVAAAQKQLDAALAAAAAR